MPPENILVRHFEKYLHDMDLKPTEHVRNTISLLYNLKKKPGEIAIFGSFLGEKFNFGLYFAENWHFQVGYVLFCHCDVIR